MTTISRDERHAGANDAPAGTGLSCAISPAAEVSIVIPTYREAGNIRELVARIEAVRSGCHVDLELVLVDDDSQDGIERVVAELGKPWIRLVVRRRMRGLSSAVLHGFSECSGRTLVVMDADLSHPPESIPTLLEQLDHGADFVIGSRYVAGGSITRRWGTWRHLNSRAAAMLARPLCAARDPMSGFFALRRSTLDRAGVLRPLGYKIALELMVRCRCADVREIPIHFGERTRGRSKLTLKQQWLYLRHLFRLWRFQRADRSPPAD